MRNSQIAAAVAAALSLSGYGIAEAFPTAAAAAGVPASNQVFIAGSSAAANALINYIETTVCGGTGWSVFTTPTTAVGLPDFRAVSCVTAAGQVDAGTLVTMWVRPEGGSAVGVLPLINGVAIKQLNMATAGCTTTAATQANAAFSCTGVAGTTPGNGTNDSFGPAGVLSHASDLGISDLEPGAFANSGIGAINAWAGSPTNDPFGTYSASFTGPDVGVDAAEAIANVTFGQVFGFVVSGNLHTAGVLDLPKSQIASLFDATVTNWNQIDLGANTAVTINANPVICNRELGSGTRAQADIFLNSDGCINAAGSLPELAGTTIGTQVQPTDNFQTIAELDCVNSHSNAIGYVSIDNFAKIGTPTSSFPNVFPISIDGVSVTGGTGKGDATNAALGAYDDWFEASINLSPHASTPGTTFFNNIGTNLASLNANVGSSSNVMAIPGNAPGNNATAPLTVGTHNVIVNAFTRGANSCHVPAHG